MTLIKIFYEIFSIKLKQNVNLVGIYTLKEDQMIDANQHKVVQTIVPKQALNLKASQIPIYRHSSKLQLLAI